MIKKINIVITLLLVFTLSNCTNDNISGNSNGDGNGSSVGNSINSSISGRVVSADSVGVSSSIVGLYLKDTNTNIENIEMVNTNEHGAFLFTDVLNGDYVVVAFENEKSIAYVNDININNKSVIIPDIISGQYGSIKGSLDYLNSDDPANDSVIIIIKELMDTTIVLDKSEFEITEIPEGEYNISISKKSGENYSCGARIVSGECTDLGVIVLKTRLWIKKSSIGKGFQVAFSEFDSIFDYGSGCSISDSIIIEINEPVSELKNLSIKDWETNAEINCSATFSNNRIAIYHDTFLYLTKYKFNLDIIHDAYSMVSMKNHQFVTLEEPNPFKLVYKNTETDNAIIEDFPVDGNITLRMNEDVFSTELVFYCEGTKEQAIEVTTSISKNEIVITPQSALLNNKMYYVNGTVTSKSGIVSDEIYTKFKTIE